MTAKLLTIGMFGGPINTLRLVTKRVDLGNVVTDSITILTKIDVSRGHIRKRDQTVNPTTEKDRGILTELMTRHHLQIRRWLPVMRRRGLLSISRMDVEMRMQRGRFLQLSCAQEGVIARGRGRETPLKAITMDHDVRKMMCHPRTSVASLKLLPLTGKPLTKPKCRAVANFCSRRW